jgi:glycosyltransferase involved in cell wall biosynthesis
VQDITLTSKRILDLSSPLKAFTLLSTAAKENPFVSIIIPAYKEEEHIAHTITQTIVKLRQNRFNFEVLVVLDSLPGDRTGLIIYELCGKFAELRVIERFGRRGVGDALRTGIRAAKGSIFVPVMGDDSESPDDLVKLVKAVARGYDMAIGDRFKHGKPYGYPSLKYIANRCCNFLIKLMFSVPSSDTTNAFKAYSATVLKQLDISSRGFEVFVETPLKVFLRVPSVNITSISVQHFVRNKSEAKLSLLKEGPRYIQVISSLFVHGRMKRIPESG